MPKVTKVDVYRVELEDGKVGYATGMTADEAMQKVLRDMELHGRMHGKIVDAGFKAT